MNGLRTYEDASRDHERFEAEQIARDSDATQCETADIDEKHAWLLVEELVRLNVVTPIAESHSFVHEPSGKIFDSEKAVAQFHKGWKAGYESAVTRPDGER